MAVLMLFGACAQKQTSVQSDFVIDEPHLLSAEQTNRITRYQAQLIKDLDIQFKLVILDKSPLNMDRTASELFEKYTVGNKTRGAKGVLLLIDPSGQQMRIETGYDLEAIFNDSFVGRVQREQMAPFYVNGQVGNGVEATVELLVTRALTATDQQSYDKNRVTVTGEHFSGGAGARTDLLIPTAITPATTANYGAQLSPEAAIDAYLKVLAEGVRDPNIGLYSAATRAFMSKSVVTEGQQKNELAELERVRGNGRTFTQNNLAVIRFDANNRRVPPYFFRREAEGWTIDLSVMSKTIGFNQVNEWYFRDPTSEFGFAFRDKQ